MLRLSESLNNTRRNRREFLRAGALGLGGLTLPNLLRAEDSLAKPTRPKSVIYIVLDGGPSHIDMWDLKPDSPVEYRGPFKPGATSLTGCRICDLMPEQARLMNKMALLRGIQSVENDHYLSEVYTGLPRTSGKRPAFGSVVSKSLEKEDFPLPPYVSLNREGTDPFEYQKPYYLGPSHKPFRPFEQSIEDLKPVTSLDQLNDRRTLLKAFDTMRRDMDRTANSGGLDSYHAKAFDIISSPKVRDAFDLSKESKTTLERYGRGKYPHQTVKDILYDWEGSRFLMARRLVEAGVRVVTLSAGSWDHHSGPTSDVFLCLKMLMPVLDRSIGALCEDLIARGLDQDVLVVVLGEFGRTPKITPTGPGREHWADAGGAVLFGGGLKMGQVIGETDARAERAKSGATNFQSIVSTIYHVLGIDPTQTFPDFNGRPQYVLDEAKPIAELVG